MQAALTKLKDQVVDHYGENSIMFASDIPVRAPISSGSLALDFAVGIGGLPPDRVIEVAGADGCGKTTLGLYTMMSFLDAQPTRGALILDTEHKLTMDWVEQLIGPQRMARVLLAWPDHMEQAIDMYTDMVSSGQISMVLFDSIGGSPTKRVESKSAERGNIGGNSLAVTNFAHRAGVYSQKYNCLTFGINQVREDLDGFHRHTTPGGRAWKHHCILRLLLRRSSRETIEDTVNGEKIQVGFKVIAKVFKNQLAAEGRTAWWWFYHVPTEKYGFGIDRLDEIIRLGVVTKVIEQKGPYYYHSLLPDGRVQGRDALMAAIHGNDETQSTIVAETMNRLRADEGLLAQVAPMDTVHEVIE